jgi:hypothetical protein
MKNELEKQLVERFPVLFAEYGGKPEKTCMAWGCDHGDGWYDLLERACVSIDAHQKYCPDCTESTSVVFEQIKEKFGTLRIYHRGGCRYVEGILSMVETMSGRICEKCGSPGELTGGGWLRTLCENCKS